MERIEVDLATGESKVIALTPEELAGIQVATEASLAGLASYVRSERNALLSASDWTQVSDAPVDKAAWATYRQALRDVTAQAGFPHSITWPSKPE
jgi:hypothetical protein